MIDGSTVMTVALDLSIRATVVIVLAGTLVALSRRAPAGIRHLIWTLTVAGLIALPALAVVAPRWSVPGLSRVLPIAAGRGMGSASEPGPRALPGTGRGESVVLGSDAAREPVDEPGIAVLSRTSDVPPGETAEPSGDPQSDLSGLAASHPGGGDPAKGGIWLLAIWSLGVIVSLVGLVRAVRRVGRLSRGARCVRSGPLWEMMTDARTALGLRRKVVLRLAETDVVPMTWGLMRPTVLLPTAAHSWTHDRVRAVLLHELAHVKRLDPLTQVMGRLACALHWFNPLVWLGVRGLRVEAEAACDDAVLRLGARPSDYAEHLLAVARSLGGVPSLSLAAVAMARSSGLSGRVEAVLDGRRDRRPVSAGLAGAATLAAAFVFVAVAGATREARATTTDAAPLPELPEAAITGTAAPLCDWSRRGDHRNSTSMSVNDDRMRIRIERDDCRLEIDAAGDLRFSDDDQDIVGISSSGYLEIEERSGGERRRLEVRPSDDGGLQRRWFINGSASQYDSEARAWLAGILPTLFRETGINAESRARRILASGGVDGLLEEIALIGSDHVARRYFTVLLNEAELKGDALRRILRQAGDEIGSDHELAQLLMAIADRQPFDEAAQIAYVEAARSLGSDHEMGRVLTAVLSRSDLSPQASAALLDAAQSIGSDHELARVLIGLEQTRPVTPDLEPAFFRTAVTIGSDFEERQVLSAVVGKGDLQPESLNRVLEAALNIGSDHEMGQLLTRIAELYGVPETIRPAFLRAVDTIGSRHERERVMARAGLREI